MTSTALVGPVTRGRVSFYGGPWRHKIVDGRVRLDLEPAVTIAYEVPQNTLDPRVNLCTDHHVACDCREADLAERTHEALSEYRALVAIVLAECAGHATVVDGWRDRRDRPDLECQCVACKIARAAHLSGVPEVIA